MKLTQELMTKSVCTEIKIIDSDKHLATMYIHTIELVRVRSNSEADDCYTYSNVLVTLCFNFSKAENCSESHPAKLHMCKFTCVSF